MEDIEAKRIRYSASVGARRGSEQEEDLEAKRIQHLVAVGEFAVYRSKKDTIFSFTMGDKEII